ADAVIGLKPDLAVITGDLVSRLGSGEAESIVQELSRLSAPLGVFAILGNHDHWTEAGVVAAAIRSAGLTLLRNASVLIERAGERIYIAGVDDIWENRHDLPLALSEVPAEGCAILLAHEPDFADEASLDRRVALQLSGHSHGGQVRVPGLGPLQLPFLGRKYPAGLRQVGGLRLYTNRGIGTIFPPLRLNCRPEVTLFELTRGYGLGVKG
ncbi:MAG: metallophosphoesterase, partial [Chloroflexi bacterium]|nr:metallophosphoesterase [Chloroflexota bacterium]